MQRINKILIHSFLFVLFTVFTQIGGFLWILCIPFMSIIKGRVTTKAFRLISYFLIFLSIYLFFTFQLVPLLARQWGRVPLPVSHPSLKPLSWGTVLLNRGYVRRELRNAVIEASDKMTEAYPGTVTLYLDAGFPFLNGYPLLPHLSHNDGKKLDLAFFYKDSMNQPLNTAPSPIGYGICEEPAPGEYNAAAYCEGNGYWQYSFLRKWMPQQNKVNYLFDSQRTKTLIQLLAVDKRIGKIFIEPHLKARMHLANYNKIRFHGCQAVRHDDHLHIQL